MRHHIYEGTGKVVSPQADKTLRPFVKTCFLHLCGVQLNLCCFPYELMHIPVPRPGAGVKHGVTRLTLCATTNFSASVVINPGTVTETSLSMFAGDAIHAQSVYTQVILDKTEKWRFS